VPDIRDETDDVEECLYPLAIPRFDLVEGVGLEPTHSPMDNESKLLAKGFANTLFLF
jgi:hypothetical protein